jgi:hypothetical protein
VTVEGSDELNSEDIDREPFLMRERTEDEVLDYDRRFVAGSDGKEQEDAKSLAWQRGWAEAQE